MRVTSWSFVIFSAPSGHSVSSFSSHLSPASLIASSCVSSSGIEAAAPMVRCEAADKFQEV